MARGARLEAKPAQTYFANAPTALYNAMIAPLKDVRLKGAVWYQGENSTGIGRGRYAELLCSMVRCWRNQFGGALPLVVVQLAGYMGQHNDPLAESGWCNVRLDEADATRQLPRAALATAVDLGEGNDIHPQRKDELGRRVALQLRRLAYGDKGVAEGPRIAAARYTDGRLVADYDRTTGPLRRDFIPVRYAVELTTGHWQWAEGRVTGDYRVEVPLAARPLRLRYAYDEMPRLSLYNIYGLPAPTEETNVK